MKIINLKLNEDYLNLKKIDKRGLVAAIGNFDGLHIGHKRLLNEAKKAAKKKNLPFAIITFNPHPREFFSKDDRHLLLVCFYLTRLQKRIVSSYGHFD